MLWMCVFHFSQFISFICINYIENSYHKSQSVFICFILLKQLMTVFNSTILIGVDSIFDTETFLQYIY